MQEPSAPLIIPIWGAKNQAYKDATRAIKVSPDGMFMAVVLERDAELRIYSLLNRQTDQLNTAKQAEKPFKIIKITENPADVLETFFFKQQQGHDKSTGGDYCLYMLSKQRITMYNLDKGAK